MPRDRQKQLARHTFTLWWLFGVFPPPKTMNQLPSPGKSTIADKQASFVRY
jgi:hypothetical protein